MEKNTDGKVSMVYWKTTLYAGLQIGTSNEKAFKMEFMRPEIKWNFYGFYNFFDLRSYLPNSLLSKNLLKNESQTEMATPWKISKIGTAIKNKQKIIRIEPIKH